MDLPELLKKRSSVRSFDPHGTIAENDVRRIFETAQRAPTSFNLQAYSYVLVADSDRKSVIADLAENQPFIKDAALFALVCADLSRLQKVNELTGREFVLGQYFESTLLAIVDASLSAQVAAVTAESLGYGVCMIGGVRANPEEIAHLCELPALVMPLFGLAMGVASKRNPPKARIPYSGVVFQEQYDEMKRDDAIADYNATMRASGVYDGRPAFADEFGDANADYGWIEHTSRRTSLKRDSKLRRFLGDIFEGRGFSLD